MLFRALTLKIALRRCPLTLELNAWNWPPKGLYMVVVGKHVTFLLIYIFADCSLVGNPHLTAKN